MLEALLVDEVTDEANRSTRNKEAVEATVGDELVGLIAVKGATVAQEIDKARRDASIDVENECGLLLGRHLLDGHGKIEDGCAREVLLGVLLDDVHAHVRVL